MVGRTAFAMSTSCYGGTENGYEQISDANYDWARASDGPLAAAALRQPARRLVLRHRSGHRSPAMRRVYLHELKTTEDFERALQGRQLAVSTTLV